ncbi:MAG: hypothetical protein MJ181_10025 [Treponema sp.]|nr:hypothetical protein [Lachnospiraceae bacterium]MCQ2598168.1 hypothetical protein [Treponema sp.]
MKFDYTVKSGNAIEQKEKPLSLNAKVDMQTRLTKALATRQGQPGSAPMMDMPSQGEGFGRTN